MSHLIVKGRTRYSFRRPVYGLSLYVMSLCVCLYANQSEKQEQLHVMGPKHHRHCYKMVTLRQMRWSRYCSRDAFETDTQTGNTCKICHDNQDIHIGLKGCFHQAKEWGLKYLVFTAACQLIPCSVAGELNFSPFTPWFVTQRQKI